MPKTLQLPGGQTITVPDDTSPEEMDQIANEMASGPQPAVSHAGPSMLDTAVESLPMIGGMAGSLAGGRTNPAGIALSGLGGAAGEATRQIIQQVRGNEPQDTESPVLGPLMKIGRAGMEQSGIEGVSRGAGGLLKLAGKGVMRGAIPPAIAGKFNDVDLAGVAIREKAIPGSARSATSIAKRTGDAGEAVQRRASLESRMGFPRIQADDTLQGADRLRTKAISAKKFGRASDIDAAVQEARKEYGPSGLDITGGLNRKQILQEEGKAALNAAVPSQAALMPKVANAERAGLTRKLRESPKMASALDRSQEMTGLNRVMQKQQHSTPLTRLRSGGLTSALASPMGLGATGITLDQLSRLPYAQLVRLAQMAALEGEMTPAASHPQ